MMRSPRQHLLPIAVLTCGLCVWAATAVLACPYSIRDSSFISNDAPTTFRLCFLTTSDAPGRSELDDAVEIATTTWLATANVVIEIVDVDLNVKHELQGAIPGRLLDPAATPAAVLISPRNEAIEIALPDDVLNGGALNDGTLNDCVMDAAVQVIDSPIRSQLAEHWPTTWCSLIVVTGDDPAQNEAALAAVNEAAARIHGTLTEMEKLVEYAPEVIVIPHDSREERLVLWSLELGSEATAGNDTTAGAAAEEDAVPPQVAMLVGRGELRGPVLSGAEITAEKVYKSLEMLGRSCSCTTDAAWLSGPVLPIEWTDAMQATVVAQLDFDPNDPTAAGAIRDVMSGLDQVLGYQEFTSGYREMKTPDAEAAADKPIAGTSDEDGQHIAHEPDAGLLHHRNGVTGYRDASTGERVDVPALIADGQSRFEIDTTDGDMELSVADVDAPQSAIGLSPTGDVDLIQHRNGTTGYRDGPTISYDTTQGFSDGGLPDEETAADGVTPAEDVAAQPVALWDSTVVLISLGVVVFILGAGTALVWGRR